MFIALLLIATLKVGNLGRSSFNATFQDEKTARSKAVFHFREAKDFEQKIALALKSGKKSKVEPFFVNQRADAYFWLMCKRNGGLGKLQVAVLPCPPGWKTEGRYWVIFHTFEDIEQDHDPVYELAQYGTQYRIGKEIPEDDLDGWKITHADIHSFIHPRLHSISVDASLNLVPGTIERAPLFRLNDVYQLHHSKREVFIENQDELVIPTPGSLVRAGSLLIPWTANPDTHYEFQYSGVLQHTSQDIVNNHEAYATAWWVPSLGRLPFTVRSTITGPANWIIRAEGNRVSHVINGKKQTITYNCPLAISYPKIIAGAYHLVASKTVKGEPFHIWQLDPINKIVGNRDLKNMIRAAAFYEKTLGPLPFHGYACYDSDEYYGIESYSHTLLNKTITHFISHEMGHCYFGGIVPCTYVHDSWNEGVTEFIDSVVLLKDKDRSLEGAFRSINVHVPLTQMPVAWSYGSASYFRGCYVMKMLEGEIGDANVLGGLKDLVRERKGIATRWDDLRSYFEKRAGRSLKWFWSQWVDHATFPALQILHENTERTSNEYQTSIIVKQSGTRTPFHLKFKISANVAGTIVSRIVEMNRSEQQYVITTRHRPDSIKLDVFPLTLAHVKSSRRQMGIIDFLGSNVLIY